MPSGGSYDNYGEVGRVVEKIIEQAQAERVEGPSLSSQVTLWGFAREFYRYDFVFSLFAGVCMLTSSIASIIRRDSSLPLRVHVYYALRFYHCSCLFFPRFQLFRVDTP